MSGETAANRVVDYDHPHRNKPPRLRPYYIGLIVLGAMGAVWVARAAIQFAVLRLRSSSTPAVIVGYERAGGQERLRVQTLKDAKPAGFFLVDARDAWPRYAPGQPVELLSWNARNRYGQEIRESAVYRPFNYWARHGVIALVAVCATLLGCLGLRVPLTPSGSTPPPT